MVRSVVGDLEFEPKLSGSGMPLEHSPQQPHSLHSGPDSAVSSPCDTVQLSLKSHRNWLSWTQDSADT